jgi:hypothetical protein
MCRFTHVAFGYSWLPQTIRDRVKKLELYVDGGKKRLSVVKKGKPALK